MSDKPVVTPEMYAQVFGPGTAGEKVLEDLIAKFIRPPVFDGGIDGVRKSDFRSGSRRVLDFIMLKINQAGGVAPAADEEQDYG
jgi:hypothetical protein